MRATLKIAAVTALALTLGAPAMAQTYPPEVLGTVTVSDQAIDCGNEPLTVSGSGWAPGQQVTISFAGEQIGTANPDAQGDFSAQVVPPDAPQGEHVLRAEQGAQSATARVTCVSGGVAGAGGGIAFTGANIATAALILLGLIAAGALTLAAGRRRSRSA